MINPVWNIARKLHVAPWVIEAYFLPFGAVNGVTAIMADYLVTWANPDAAIYADQNDVSMPLALLELGRLTIQEFEWLGDADIDTEETDRNRDAGARAIPV